MYNTSLGLFCTMHDNWRELLIAEPYFLKIKEDGDYIMFNYDQLASDFNIPIVEVLSRTIISNMLIMVIPATNNIKTMIITTFIS